MLPFLSFTPLEQLVVGTRLSSISPRALLLAILGLARRLEEQTGALALLDGVGQVAAMCRVTVVLNVFPARGIGQSVLVLCAQLLHEDSHGFLLSGIVGGGGLQSGENGRGDEGGVGGGGQLDEVGVGLQRDGRVGVAAEDALDGGGRVEAGGDGAAQGFDARNGFGGGARDNEVDGRGELLGVLRGPLAWPCVGVESTYPGQQLDAVPLDAVDAARLVQLLHGDGLRGVQAALVDPRLDAVEVDGRHFHLEAVRISASCSCSCYLSCATH
jgi:hypothetical protein